MHTGKKIILKDNLNYEIPQSLKNKIYFIIPAYNEEKVISKVIKELNKNGYHNLILINDGSKDKTSEVILKNKTNGLVLLEHVINRGQGAALKTGFDYVKKQKNCKYVVTFDSDGQHRISDLKKFIYVLENYPNIDIVLGSRFLTKKSIKLVPLKKIILLKTSILVTLFLSNILLTDSHNGYRVFRKEILNKINITLDGFEHASEILDEISKNNIKFAEIPVYIDYTDYSKAKGQKISNAINIVLKILFKK